ncbi:hypothetical protein [Hydrogenovibrio marinus]|uniref:Uncharacterized protein n=1 Tax=Hydrogenovibrio marinus TaxID=28885 RepID=A0A066ZLG7_HYDMR|nr:hypothetical protein [Hydrogenovibrio marinus]KDN94653.1 hypothetical protein EI16_12195 [Hydrogenovibrio marinus]
MEKSNIDGLPELNMGKISSSGKGKNFLKLIADHNQEPIFDVTYHDSNEEPEEDCVNTVISFKLGDKVFQYFNIELEQAISQFKAHYKLMHESGVVDLPNHVFCVVTKFKEAFFINWQTVQKRPLIVLDEAWEMLGNSQDGIEKFRKEHESL